MVSYVDQFGFELPWQDWEKPSFWQGKENPTGTETAAIVILIARIECAVNDARPLSAPDSRVRDLGNP